MKYRVLHDYVYFKIISSFGIVFFFYIYKRTKILWRFEVSFIIFNKFYTWSFCSNYVDSMQISLENTKFARRVWTSSLPNRKIGGRNTRAIALRKKKYCLSILDKFMCDLYHYFHVGIIIMCLSRKNSRAYLSPVLFIFLSNILAPPVFSSRIICVDATIVVKAAVCTTWKTDVRVQVPWEFVRAPNDQIASTYSTRFQVDQDFRVPSPDRDFLKFVSVLRERERAENPTLFLYKYDDREFDILGNVEK